MVFEDVHWADDAMLDFVAQLAQSDEPVPLLVVCSARPELLDRRPDWVHAIPRTINLDPLTSEQTEQLVQVLLEGAEVDPAILEELVSRADGNPLYAEQFVRVARSGSTPAAGLPDSVQAVIAARLDVLESSRKSVLQDAAVVGHVFWSGAVSAIGAREPRDVESDLDALADQQFVRPNADSSMQDDHEFSFWHAIVRDVCYSQIPRAARATRHRRAAAWIEHRAGARLEDLADVLAHHHTQALSLDEARGQVEDADRDSARRFLVLSGDRGMALNVVQAEAAYARALELTPPGHPDRPMVLARHGEALRLSGRVRDAEAALTEAVAGFRAQGATLELGRALIGLVDVMFLDVDSRAADVAEQARELFERLPPGPDLIEVYGQLAGVAGTTNDYDGVEHWFQRTREVCAATGLPIPARVQGMHGMMRVARGDRAGLDEMRAAASTAEAEGNYGRAMVTTNNLILDQWIFDGPAAVLADALEATERSAARGITGPLALPAGPAGGAALPDGRLEDRARRAVSARGRARGGRVRGTVDVGARGPGHDHGPARPRRRSRSPSRRDPRPRARGGQLPDVRRGRSRDGAGARDDRCARAGARRADRAAWSSRVRARTPRSSASSRPSSGPRWRAATSGSASGSWRRCSRARPPRSTDARPRWPCSRRRAATCRMPRPGTPTRRGAGASSATSAS